MEANLITAWPECSARERRVGPRSPPRGFRRKAKQVASGQNGKCASDRHSTEISSPKHRNGSRNAFDHSLDSAETLVKLGAILGRIRLVSSDAVLTQPKNVSIALLMVRETNRTMAELVTTLHSGEFEVLEHFSDACGSSFVSIRLLKR